MNQPGTTPDGEDAPHCSPVKRPFPGEEETKYWIGNMDTEYDTPFERLITGDVSVDWGDGEVEEFTPTEFFQMWAQIEPSLRDDNATAGYEKHETSECAVCERLMVSVPGVNAECEVCGATKHDFMRMHWELYVSEYQLPPNERQQLFDIPIHTKLFQDGITCPDGHYICDFCLGELPDTRPVRESDFPEKAGPSTSGYFEE